VQIFKGWMRFPWPNQ